MTTPPIKISDETIELAARMVAEEHGSTVFEADHEEYEFSDAEREQYRAEAQAVAEVVAPLIAAQVLRAAADALRACQTCGKAHEYRKVSPAGRIDRYSWADPDDGHEYRPVQMHRDEFGPWLLAYPGPLAAQRRERSEP